MEGTITSIATRNCPWITELAACAFNSGIELWFIFWLIRKMLYNDFTIKQIQLVDEQLEEQQSRSRGFFTLRLLLFATITERKKTKFASVCGAQKWTKKMN